MGKNTFVVHVTDNKLWNLTDLLTFLSCHQNQEINLILNPEAVPAETVNLYKILDCFQFEKVSIQTHNPFESHSTYEIKRIAKNPFINEDGSVAQKFWEWNLKKKFLAIYGRPTAARLGIAAHMFDHHSADTHLHFSSFADSDALQNFELDKLANYDSSLIAPVGRLIRQMPCCLHDSSGYLKTNYNYNDPLTSLYQDALIDIVVEPHVMGTTFFPTEKTFRAMWCQRPFITFASADFLAYLRQMGFRTFGDFWDEDYDGYHTKERLRRIIDLIDTISTLNYDQLESMFWSMKYTLEHNYNVLKTQCYKTHIEKIV